MSDRFRSWHAPALGKSPTPIRAPDSSDPRVAARQELVRFVWYSVISEQAGAEQSAAEGLSRTCDISQTGIGLWTITPLPPGASVFLEIALTTFTMSAVGKVMNGNVDQDGWYRAGIQFRVVPPNDRLRLDALLEASKVGNGSEE